MKTALYVAAVTRTYRKAIDYYYVSEETYRANMDWYRAEIAKCTYRQYSTGFYFGKPSAENQIYDNSTYDWLEGRIGEYGVGFLWRRKLQHFSDILRFKSEKADLPPVDTTYRKRNIEEKKNEKN
jgi:collagenase-like PrtC family protease